MSRAGGILGQSTVRSHHRMQLESKLSQCKSPF